MKAQFSEYGDPASVLELAADAEPGAPGAGEVLIDVEAFPLNPDDSTLVSGRFCIHPPRLPHVPGSEAVVTAVDSGVGNVRPGGWWPCRRESIPSSWPWPASVRWAPSSC